jgi:hypothetical protein
MVTPAEKEPNKKISSLVWTACAYCTIERISEFPTLDSTND